jgi:carboxypeptidase Taq
MLRFEIEKDLVSGALKPADVPVAWNEKVTQYFGLTVPSDANGCLQDIHWSAGLLGYFPTYALGNMYAAQLFNAAERDLGSLNGLSAKGYFKPLKSWLNEKIHRHGKRYPAKQLVQVVTGETLSHAPLIAHLRSKYSELYGL